MDIKEIYPKDVVVVIEFRATELEKIKMAMDDCKLTYFGLDKEKMEAQDFFKINFYNFVTDVMKSLKNE